MIVCRRRRRYFICNVMGLNGMHVEDVEDICMECNTTYSRLNDMHVEDVEDDKNTHNVTF